MSTIHLYKKTFGEFQDNCIAKSPAEMREMSLLADYARRPGDLPLPAYNEEKVPKNFWERYKWLVGVENNLDREIQETYQKAIQLLEGTTPTSIYHLRNQMLGFYWTNQQIKNYKDFKAEKQKQAQSFFLDKILFIYFKCVFQFFYKPSEPLRIKKTIGERLGDTSIKIGSFTDNDKMYEVVAKYYLGDRDNQLPMFGGLVEIKINSPVRQGIFRSFGAKIEQEGYYEAPIKLNIPFVKYRDKEDPEALLDQKLTQIMIEVANQNGVHIIEAHPNCSDPTKKAGFKIPSNNVSSRRFLNADKFEMEDLRKKIRALDQSWETIINQSPILIPDAAVM